MRTTTYTLLIFLTLALSIRLSSAQTAASQYGIFVSYSNPTTELKEGEVSSNQVMVINNTKKRRDVEVIIMPPTGWRIIGVNRKKLSINPRDTAYIPARIHPTSALLGGTIYKAKAVLYSENIQIGTALWHLNKTAKSDWKQSILLNNLYLNFDSDSVEVNVNYSNRGNMDEEITIDLIHSRKLEIIDTPEHFTVNLPEGTDTVISFKIRLNRNEIQHSREINTLGEGTEKYKMQVKSYSAGTKSHLQNTNINVIRTPNSIKQNLAKRESLPLTIDLQTYDIFSENPYANLNLTGIKQIDFQTTLNYSVNVTASTANTNKPVYSDYQYLGYSSPTTKAAIGNIGLQQSSGLNLNGKGVKAWQKLTKNHALEAGYIRSPKLFGNSHTVEGATANYFYEGLNKNIKGLAYGQRSWETLYQARKTILGALIQVIPIKGNVIKVEGAYSENQQTTATDSVFNLNGYRVYASYAGVIARKFRLYAAYTNNSENFAGTSGLQNFNSYVQYHFNREHSLKALYSNYSFRPTTWSEGELVSNSYTSLRTNYQLKYKFQKKSSTFDLFGRYYEENSLGYNLYWSGGGIEVKNRPTPHIRWYGALIFGINNLDNFAISNYVNAILKTTIAIRDFSASFRYCYGPNYLYEHIDYKETGLFPRTLFLNMRYEWWIGANKNTHLNINANTNYRTVGEQLQIGVRPEITHFISSSFKINAYAYLGIYGRGEQNYYYNTTEYYTESYTRSNFEVGIGFTKSLGVPISKKKNYDIKFMVFIDKNGNRVMDLGEEPVPNLLINAEAIDQIDEFTDFSTTSNLEIITNDDGIAYFTNIRQGEYTISTIPLEKNSPWLNNQTLDLNIHRDEVIMLPQTRGAKIEGTIVLEKSNYSQFDNSISLANIRITATDTIGNRYSCLSNSNGRYILNLPVGTYILNLNEEVFGETFMIPQNNRPVSLTSEDNQYQHTFYVHEKSRSLNIKSLTPKAAVNDSLQNRIDSSDTTLIPAADTIPVMNTIPVMDSIPMDTLNSIPADTTLQQTQEPVPAEEASTQEIEFRVLVYPISKYVATPEEFDKAPKKVTTLEIDGYNYYISGQYSKLQKAQKLADKFVKKGFVDATAIPFENGKPIIE